MPAQASKTTREREPPSTSFDRSCNETEIQPIMPFFLLDFESPLECQQPDFRTRLPKNHCSHFFMSMMFPVFSLIPLTPAAETPQPTTQTKEMGVRRFPSLGALCRSIKTTPTCITNHDHSTLAMPRTPQICWKMQHDSAHTKHIMSWSCLHNSFNPTLRSYQSC